MFVQQMRGSVILFSHPPTGFLLPIKSDREVGNLLPALHWGQSRGYDPEERKDRRARPFVAERMRDTVIVRTVVPITISNRIGPSTKRTFEQQQIVTWTPTGVCWMSIIRHLRGILNLGIGLDYYPPLLWRRFYN